MNQAVVSKEVNCEVKNKAENKRMNRKGKVETEPIIETKQIKEVYNEFDNKNLKGERIV